MKIDKAEKQVGNASTTGTYDGLTYTDDGKGHIEFTKGTLSDGSNWEHTYGDSWIRLLRVCNP